MDKIIVKGLKIFAYHGVNPEEKQDGQQFEIDLTADIDLKAAGLSDDLGETESYARIIKTVKRVFTAEKYDLIEKAAEVIAEAVLDEYGKINEVTVTVKKPFAPVSAEFDYVAVEITRRR
ncbi:MAG: dihydroneopterin aldolase [Ruminococcaceae bacterium]|nr:dihydroneopterin aldolase [Oscillospiraceae bacterium]